MSAALHSLVCDIEARLARTYSFPIATSATDCLLSEEAAVEFSVVSEQRAAVLIREHEDGAELGIGVYIHRSLTEQLERMNPLAQLQNSNLDAFCVLVEEISHFHLLVNRALDNRSVTRLELEWQGEIDKVLLAGALLLEQTGSPCFRQLAHMIFDRSTTLGNDVTLYQEALHYAARCWYRLLPQLKGLTAHVQWAIACQELRRTYPLHWTAKLEAISRL